MAFDSLPGLLSGVAVVVVAVLFFLLLFEPGLPYRFTPPRHPIDSREFVNFLSAIVNARLFSAGDARVLNSGASIFEAELAALLRAAGGKVYWYQPIAWYTLKRFNNRTHRDILVVDAEVAFVGGAGVADYWIGPAANNAPWRDTMLRVTGELVKGLQTAFAENWLEASGEILAEEDFLLTDVGEPRVLPPGSGLGMVINSSPSAGRSTQARILFQVLVASARKSIEICSPY